MLQANCPASQALPTGTRGFSQRVRGLPTHLGAPRSPHLQVPILHSMPGSPSRVHKMVLLHDAWGRGHNLLHVARSGPSVRSGVKYLLSHLHYSRHSRCTSVLKLSTSMCQGRILAPICRTLSKTSNQKGCQDRRGMLLCLLKHARRCTDRVSFANFLR
jgi:hypothetical protein